jgi:hypothetical protein
MGSGRGCRGIGCNRAQQLKKTGAAAGEAAVKKS